MDTLSIDIETFRLLNLTKTGVYPDTEHNGFEVLLFGYAIDNGPTRVVDLASGETLPGCAA